MPERLSPERDEREKPVEGGVSWLRESKAAQAVAFLAAIGLWGGYAAKNYERNASEPVSPPKAPKSIKGETGKDFSPVFEAHTLNQPESRKSFIKSLKEGKVGFEVYARDLFREDDQGERQIDYSALISPVGIALNEVVPESAKTEVYVPYEYAREFDIARELNPEDSERLKEYLVTNLENELVREQISGLDCREVYLNAEEQGQLARMNPQERAGLEVDHIEITGFASPEGPEFKGPETVVPGSVDPENIALSTRRAEHAEPVVAEALKEVMKDSDSEAFKDIEIIGKEVQFSQAEWQQLDQLATRLGFQNKSPEAKVFSMILDFNDHEITDEAALKTLQEIVGSKRSVALTVEYQNDQKETFLIPIPLIALLAAAPWLRRRRRKEEEEGDDSQKDEKSFKLPPKTKPTNRTLRPPQPGPVPGKSTKTPETPPTSKLEPEPIAVPEPKPIPEPEPEPVINKPTIDTGQWEKGMSWWREKGETDQNERGRTVMLTIYQDLEPAWEKTLAIAQDESGEEESISYSSLLGELSAEIEQAELTPEQRDSRIKELTEEILQAWQEYDEGQAIKAGIDPMTVETKFRQYFQEDRQIKWAIAHAEVLMATAEAKKEYDKRREENPGLPEKEGRDFLTEVAKKLL